MATTAALAASFAITYLALQPDDDSPVEALPAPASVNTTQTSVSGGVAPITIASAESTLPKAATTSAAVAALASDPCLAAADASTIDAALDECPFTIASAKVIDVPADEGFWIAAPDGQPAWVHLIGTGESPEQIKADQTVTLSGVIRANKPPDSSAGAPPDEEAQIDLRTAHLEVPFSGISIAG